MCDVLDYDPPDLVVLNGDLINGDTTSAHNSTHYIDQIVAPLVERKLTWASTYGNHDHSVSQSGDSILEREQTFSGSRTKKMLDANLAGTTNYYLPVYPAGCTSSGSSCTPELILWFFDSRGGSYFEGDAQPDWVDTSVVTWFNETSASLAKQYSKTLPSLVFLHIPINATWALQVQDGVNADKQPGINDELPVPQQEGWCTSDDATPNCDHGSRDTPLMQALVSIPGIMGVFYGHDHGNSWCYKWDTLVEGMTVKGNGINLCYGQHTGYGGYGDWIRGGRQIVVSEAKLKDFVVDTHIRLETGDIVGAVTLNSTYNQDLYPATPQQYTFLGQKTNGVVNVFASADMDSSSSSISAKVATADSWLYWVRMPAAACYAALVAFVVFVVL